MIVEPDFLDHWKTRLLVRLLNTETAPLYVIRIWAHCQSRKTHRFTGWNPDVLASVCRWVSDSQTLWDAMGKTFLVIEGDTVTAHDWDNVNASLISSWENGKKGGRPKTSQSTPPKPNENPPVNPPKTDLVSDREDREEKIEKTTPLTPTGGVPVEEPQKEEPKKRERKKRDPNSIPEGFNEFWEIYPRKMAKGDAIKAWQQMDAMQHFGKIIEAVNVSSKMEAWVKEGGRFIPFPATWLRAQRWEDELGLMVESKGDLLRKIQANRGFPNHPDHANATAEEKALHATMSAKYKAME